MHADQVGQHFNLRPNFELRKQRHYHIIPTGMRYNNKGRWQPGQWPPMGVVSLVYYLHCGTDTLRYSRHLCDLV